MPSDMEPQPRSEVIPESSAEATRGRGADLLTLIAAAGVGATAMYVLDPARGRRRRHLLGDKLVHATRVAGDVIQTTRRDVANHARGVGALARRRLASDEGDDVVLTERVRAKLGRAVSHPSAIEVTVEQGRVTLRGPVLAHEADQLIAQVTGVRGVDEVEDRLERHEGPGHIAGLQGGAESPASRFELLQENWTPTARLLTTVIGASLAGIALRDSERRNPLAAVVELAGFALFVRGATNMPFGRLIGVGAGRRAVTVQKAINIAAPIDEVFARLTEWERWPEWMSHVREVTRSGVRGAEGERTHWVVDGPARTTVLWDAVTTRLVPPELIAWQTVDGASSAHGGRIRLVATDDELTSVDVHMTYKPIAGAAGHAVVALFGRDPKRQLDGDLARLKVTIETGRSSHDAAVRRSALRATVADVDQVTCP